MKTIETVSLLTQSEVSFTLLYAHAYDFTQTHLLNYLQSVRSHALAISPSGGQLEQDYWDAINGMRQRVVSLLEPPDNYDAIVDPPSLSGNHRPYLAACHKAIGRGKPIIRMIKREPVSASTHTLHAMSECCCIKDPLGQPLNIASLNSILIVDDVYATGKTVAVIVEKLRQRGLPPHVSITVACPLRVITQSPITSADIP